MHNCIFPTQFLILIYCLLSCGYYKISETIFKTNQLTQSTKSLQSSGVSNIFSSDMVVFVFLKSMFVKKAATIANSLITVGRKKMQCYTHHCDKTTYSKCRELNFQDVRCQF